MSGEGIEHAWACFKLHHRRLPLSQKCGKEKFRHGVRQSFCAHIVLLVGRCRNLAKRDRRHTVNYDVLDNELHVPAEKKSFSLIEKMSVERKIHRNTKDFACEFVNDIA